MKLLKFVFKWALRVFLALVVIVVLLVIFKDRILRSVVERQIYTQTGMEVRIGRFSSSFTSPAVSLENLRLYNTPEFGGAPFVIISELHMEYDPVAARRGKLGFKLVRFNLAELNMVRNEAGKLNTDMKSLQKKSGQRGQFEFGGIGTLNLTLGKVRYTDLKTPANNREVNLGVRDEVFKNIRSEDELYGVLFVLMLRHGVDLGGATGLTPLKL